MKNKKFTNFKFTISFQNSGYIQDGNKSGLVNLSSKLLNEGTKEVRFYKICWTFR